MNTKKLEEMIISGLLKNKPFSNVAITFTKPEYFEDESANTVSKIILDHVEEYHTLPTKDAIEISLDKNKTLTETSYSDALEFVEKCFDIEHAEQDVEFLLDECEKHYKNRAVSNAIIEGIEILEGKHKKKDMEAIPSILQEALSVCFDTSVGHDYFEDAVERKTVVEETKIPCKLKLMNKITNGGILPKTLTVILGVSGGGKSMMMSDWGAFLLKKGYNVAYFTMELSEKMVGVRFDANILDSPLTAVDDMPVEAFENNLKAYQAKTQGRLFIKEFPQGAANVNDFRRILNELKLKKNFKPDIIFVDYLSICSSSRFGASETNSYGFVKAIAEEVRGLAQELDIPAVTGGQLNRSAYGGDDKSVGMDNVSDSLGIAFTADLMLSLYTDEGLKEEGKVIVTQLKNRFGDPDSYKRFAIGQDSSRMKFFDLSDNADENAYYVDKEKKDSGVSDMVAVGNNVGLPDNAFGVLDSFDYSKFET